MNRKVENLSGIDLDRALLRAMPQIPPHNVVYFNVHELEGTALDYALLVALNKKPIVENGSVGNWIQETLHDETFQAIKHNDWAHLGPLMVQHNINAGPMMSKDGVQYAACVAGQEEVGVTTGDTLSEAIARQLVRIQLGDKVAIPAEIFGSSRKLKP